METLAISNQSCVPQMPGVATFSRTAAFINNAASAEEIDVLVDALVVAKNSFEFWIGDTVNKISEMLSDGHLSEVQCENLLQDRLGLTYSDAINAQYIASIPAADRRTELSAAHHKTIGRFCKTAAEQLRWLEIAASERLTVCELADSIRANAITKQTSRKNKSVHSAEEITQIFRRFRTQLFSGRKESDLRKEEAEILKIQLKDLIDFIRLIEFTLAQSTF